MIKIYTDGSLIKGNKGGWAVVVVDKNKVVATFMGGQLNTTSNRMELYAFYRAIDYISRDNKSAIYSDSQYVVRSFNFNYNTKVHNDLWKRIRKSAKLKSVKVVWIRGHNGNKYNELADEYATRSSGEM